ncbi:MAG TPA: hypothetical protein VGM34_02900 [Chlamydiales bacterium]|jgi:hypothetical protein
MTTWKTELSGSLLSAAIVLPTAYATAGVHPVTGAILLGSAELVGRFGQDMASSLAGRLGINQRVADAAALLGHYAGGIFLSRQLVTAGVFLSRYVVEITAVSTLPLSASVAMLTGALLVINFVRKKLVPMKRIDLAKEIVEEFILRPSNGALCAGLAASLLTGVSPLAAALMGGITFLAARIAIFVTEKAFGKELREPAKLGGAFGGWWLSSLALSYFGFQQIALPIVFLGGVVAMFPAVVIWSGLQRLSEIGFKHFGWAPPVKQQPAPEPEAEIPPPELGDL